MAVRAEPTVIPVDEFVLEELYPGYTRGFGSQPFVAGPVRPFKTGDHLNVDGRHGTVHILTSQQ